MQKRKLNRVLIAGATYANELIGAFLIKKFEQFPQLISRSSFETQILLSNPEAFPKGVRYIDIDLNRSFNQQLLGKKLTVYENFLLEKLKKCLVQMAQA